MTDRQAMMDLADRCEQAEGGGNMYDLIWQADALRQMDERSEFDLDSYIYVLSFVDEALMLIPEGWHLHTLSQRGDKWYARVDDDGGDFKDARAVTAGLAITAAILRTKAGA